MAELKLSSTPYHDSLLTHSGDLFFGDFKEVNIIVLRTLDPVLPVSSSNISEIQFSKKELYQQTKNMSAIVSSHYGDNFSAHILLKSIKIISSENIMSIDKDNIIEIDIDWLEDDKQIKSQIRTLDNQTIQGILVINHISLETTYQSVLNIKPEYLESVTFIKSDKHSLKKPPISHKFISNNYFIDSFKDGTLGPEMIKLPSATYFRGDNAGDDDERPAMPINIKAFSIGSQEVTFKQYDQFCDDKNLTRPDDQEWGRGSRPVVNVSWIDAIAYTNWLSKKTGKIYRLPTDAEWEYAARADTKTQYWWGNKTGIAMANCADCSSLWSGEKTAPVGRFPANAFGLYDTAGNVFEWVQDCYHNTFEHASIDGSAIDKLGCGKRVIRGGAWSFPAKECRSANRWRDFPTRRSDDTGFRVVRELE